VIVRRRCWDRLLLFITTLPLNLVPVVGTVGIQNCLDQRVPLRSVFAYVYVFFNMHRAQYSEIGRVKAALDLVPVINSYSSILFAVVAGPWAADIQAAQLESQI
jgi:hypothetical protein